MAHLQFSRGCSLLAVLYAAMAPSAVSAQENKEASDVTRSKAARQDRPPNAVGNDDRFKDIIVTARRRTERLLDVPVTASALSQEQLQRYSTNTLAAVAQQTPQLIIGEAQTASGGILTLRGVGAGASNPSVDQAVAINVDDVQLSDATILRVGQFDLQRVEVLKGPQTLFYGKNAPAGVISLISNGPTPDLEAQVRGGYEFAAQQRFVEAIISGPLGGGFGFRGVGYWSDQDGYFRNRSQPIFGPTKATSSPGSIQPNGNEQTEKFGRLTLVYSTPDSAVDAKLKVNYSDVNRPRNGITASQQYFYCPGGSTTASPGDCRVDRYYNAPDIRPEDAALLPPVFDTTRFRSKVFLSSFSVNSRLSEEITLSSITGYFRGRQEIVGSVGGTFPNVPNASLSTHTQFTQEIRLQSSFEGPLNFLVGGYYQDGNYRAFVPVIFVPVGLLPVKRWDLRTTAASGFGQLSYKIDPKIELSAGGRYSYERKDVTGTNTVAGVETAFTVARPSRSFTNFSPEITLSYKPIPDLTTYVSYRKGFTSGGYNTTGSVTVSPLLDISYDQTTVAGFEGGIKGYALDRQLRFDLSAYRYTYKGLQLSTLRFENGIIAALVQNAGSARGQGLEANAVLRPRGFPALELRVGGAYNDAKYLKFFGACYGGQTIAQGCNLNPRVTPTPANPAGLAANPFTAQDQAGQTLARAPKWNFNAGATYDHTFSETLGASLSVDGRYTSSYLPDYGGNPNSRQTSVWLLNGNVTLYGGEARGWQVALLGRNLTNRLRIIQSSEQAAVGNGTANGVPAALYGSVTEPRAVMLELTLKSSLLGK